MRAASRPRPPPVPGARLGARARRGVAAELREGDDAEAGPAPLARGRDGPEALPGEGPARAGRGGLRDGARVVAAALG
eukprot:189215-Lingulodinium_polyedra.AAC.1